MLAQNDLLSTKITVTKLYERSETNVGRKNSSNSLLKKPDLAEFSDDETLSTCSGATSRCTFTNDSSFTENIEEVDFSSLSPGEQMIARAKAYRKNEIR